MSYNAPRRRDPSPGPERAKAIKAREEDTGYPEITVYDGSEEMTDKYCDDSCVGSWCPHPDKCNRDGVFTSSKEMTDKTDLIEWILMKMDVGCLSRRHNRKKLADIIIQFCIKSDEAREYWTNPIQRDYEWEAYIANERERIVEQACGAMDIFDALDSKMSKRIAIKAIRDRFNSS